MQLRPQNTTAQTGITAGKAEVLAQSVVPLKAKMLAKLDETQRWSYISVPEGMSRSELVSGMRSFIENNLSEFIGLCIQVLPHFSQQDSASIGTEYLTENATKFVDLFTYLEKNGFPGPRSYKRVKNFWSGEEARNRAAQSLDQISDNQIPAIAVMFDLCAAIQDIQRDYDHYLRFLSASISRVYAAHAHSIANVYMSSDKPCESPGFTVGNNFWEAELATLQQLMARKQLADIQIHLYDHINRTWNKPVSLFSEDGMALTIRRRSLHRHDNQALSDRFKAGKSEAERELWRKSGERPAISFGRLKRMTMRWRGYAGCRLFTPAAVHNVVDNSAAAHNGLENALALT